MKKYIFNKINLLSFLIGALVFILFLNPQKNTVPRKTIWKFQAIDTMKYSRDISREKLRDASFNLVIDKQIQKIAATGATHVGIATPYDEEFFPMLQKWVAAARKYHLKIWFRGNWSGWEEWFDYPKIERKAHIAKTKEFIFKHPDIFQDGDVFTACPECENGGPGDPRITGDIKGHRQFLIDEYLVTKSAFKQIGKNVQSNYNSMNGDVATVVMDSATTNVLDGIVTIDHYVTEPEQLIEKIRRITAQSGGKVVLGEFGVPIPDINGDMTQDQQAAWISQALSLLAKTPEVVGINYWTNQGSSTALWNDDGNEKKAVSVIKKFYSLIK